MTNQLNIILLSVGALQGALISFFLFRKKSKDPSQVYFILFLIVIGLQLTFKAIAKGWLWNNVQLIYLLSYSLPFLIGPLLYLFVRTRKHPVPFKPKDCLHFIPFAVHLLHTLIDNIFYYSFLPSYWWKIFPWPSLDLLSLFSYSLVSWRQLHSMEKQNIERGLKQFLVWVVSTETIIIITIAFMVRNIDTFPDVRLLFIALTLLIYWISYKLISEPELFTSTNSDATAIALKVESSVKYAHSGLKPEEADRIATLLHDAMYQQKIFLEADVTIETVANKLGVAKHNLSRVINERFRKTYVELANGWRLEEARSRLTDPKFRSCTISTIALDSGFNSVSSFNTMFKRHFQVTPSVFRERDKKEKSA